MAVESPRDLFSSRGRMDDLRKTSVKRWVALPAVEIEMPPFVRIDLKAEPCGFSPGWRHSVLLESGPTFSAERKEGYIRPTLSNPGAAREVFLHFFQRGRGVPLQKGSGKGIKRLAVKLYFVAYRISSIGGFGNLARSTRVPPRISVRQG